MTGLFITLEGPEGSGKTTHAERLTQQLSGRGLDVVHTHEPGGTDIGDKIREILLSTANEGMSARAELFLFLASRAELVGKVIKPALAEGKIVICDRFADATMAYQSHGRLLDETVVSNMNQFATGGLQPDLTIILDIQVPIGLRRALEGREGKGDRMERADVGFHQRVRAGYLALARCEPGRIKVVEVDKTVAKTEKAIRSHVDKLVKKLDKEGSLKKAT